MYQFSDEVQIIFAFLKNNHFISVSGSSSKVRYESQKVYIEITHGEWDGEVAISFGRLGQNEEFSFTLFLRLVNPDLEKFLGERLAYQPDQISNCLLKLADALKTDGNSIIIGDDQVFDKMKDVRWWHFQPSAIK